MCTGNALLTFLTSKEQFRSNRFIQFAIAATEEALLQSGWQHLPSNQNDPEQKFCAIQKLRFMYVGCANTISLLMTHLAFNSVP